MSASKLNQLKQIVQSSIHSKNQQIETLDYLNEASIKAFNDTLRVYEAKLAYFGIPNEKIGFCQIETKTLTTPAGFVTKR